MRIGLDFDNTIVCYDELFHRLATERSFVPPGLPRTKAQVRERLRQTGREEDWTRLQGEAYGPRIREATPFPGVIDFISLCRRESIPVFIISHKTRRPYLGEGHDLHAAAFGWLEYHGLLAPGAGLSREDVFLEPTKTRKLTRIATQRCSHFIDDLPEILADPAFPAHAQRILFDPTSRHDGGPALHCVSSWARLSSLLFQEVSP